VTAQGVAALERYPQEWEATMGAPLSQAVANRRYLNARWSDDPAVLSDLVRETWIAFAAYGRRKPNR